MRGHSIMAAAVDVVVHHRKCDSDAQLQKLRRRGRANIESRGLEFSIQDEESSCRGLVPYSPFSSNDDADFEGVMEAVQAVAQFIDESLVKFLEDVLFMVVGLYRAKNWTDAAYVAVGFVKLRIKGSLVGSVIRHVFKFINMIWTTAEVQDLDESIDSIRNFRSFINKWETIKESAFGKKFSKVVKYMTALGLTSLFGKEPDEKTLKAVEKTSSDGWTKINFIGSLIDFISLTTERILVFIKTGEWDSFIHGEVSYQKWYDEVMRLKRLSLGIGNLGAFGTTYHKFVGDLKQAIEDGRSIVKYSAAVGFEKKIAQSLLNDLEVLNCNILSKKAAQQERKAPFGLLVFGGSGVAKSSFTKMLYYHFGKLRGLPTEDEYRYVRNPSDDFWSGFNSQQWCIQMDDIGYLFSSKASEDKSLFEIIQVVNNVPLVPNQANLEDKGRTPLRAELVIATSNAKDLNAPSYFHCPLAVQRRLPWVVTVTPKKEYEKADSPGMIDPQKLPPVDGCYPDYWNILVERVVPAGEASAGRTMATHEKIQEFNEVHDFLDWYKEAIFSFDHIQRKAMSGDEQMRSIQLCGACSRPVRMCKCERALVVSEEDEPEVQAGVSVVFPDHVGPRESWVQVTQDTQYIYEWSVKHGTYYCLELETRIAYPIERKYPFRVQEVDEIPTLTMVDAAEILRDGFRGANKGAFRNAMVFGLSAFIKVSSVGKKTIERLKPKVQVGVTVYLPPGIEPGLNWSERDGEARRDYFWRGDKLFCHHATANGIYRATACDWSYGVKPKVQHANVDMADILRESIRRGCSCTKGSHILGNIMIGAISLYHRFAIVRSVIHFALRFKPVRSVGSYFVHSVSMGHPKLKLIYSTISAIQNHVNHYGIAYKLILGLGVVSAIWNGITWLWGPKSESEAEEIKSEANEDKDDDPVPRGAVQGQRLAVASDFFTKNEEENVWKKDDYQTTSFDTTPTQHCFATLPLEQVRDKLARNLIRISVQKDTGASSGHAVCVGGHLWVSCKHFFRENRDKYVVDLLFEAPSKGCSRNMTTTLYREDMLFHPTKDQVWFELRGVEVKSDITEHISKDSLDGVFNGVLICRDNTTRLTPRIAKGILKVEYPDPQTGIDEKFWRAHVDSDTKDGDCGGMLVSHKEVAAILGLHYMGGHMNYAFSVPLCQSDVVMARTRFTRPLIQEGIPQLNYSGSNKVLGALHHKSPVRWLKSGSLIVYGTFSGFRAKPRSRVRPTLLGPQIREERGWEEKYAAPDLKDWRPWNIAYEATCNQGHDICNADIDACVDGYVADILEGLTEDAKRNLQTLNTYDAINGISGVKYIDKMNFNSSMGEPYNHSKKYHLVSEPKDTAPEGRIFDDEVMQRIDALRATYDSGRRGYAVYSGQVKDEARTLAKIALGKLRIFTGSSVEMSVVMREQLLTFVKVFQENPLLFEGAPGAVCQSKQWTRFRQYLTQFGEENMIAGDYETFDKKMRAAWILAAFEVIIRILLGVGWTSEQVLCIFALSEDVAFPLVNMNGDLVMFRGSNPSGQPLTVIINCIVNSLYMRFCYMKLHPSGTRESVKQFKKHVALLTYGDDNAAGSRAPWFNHTAIVGVLASIGVKYTMADKTSKSVPFIHIDQVSFLKRMWVYNDEAGGYFCPLEEESIHKMLTIAVRSKTVTDDRHMADVIRAAHQEWFWYGKEKFDEEDKYLRSLIPGNLEMHFADRGLPSWGDYLERYHRASKNVEDFYSEEMVDLLEAVL